MSFSLSGLVQHVNSNDNPLLFVDTCSVLDVMRLLERSPNNNQFAREWNAVNRVVNAAFGQPTTLNLVLMSQVKGEYENNSEDVLCGLTKHVQMIDGALDRLRSTRVPTMSSLSKIDRAEAVDIFRRITKDIIDKSIELIEDETCLIKGLKRNQAETPPGVKGNQGADCIIYEHYLECSRMLRDKNYQGNIVYLTSNTNDYMHDGKPATPINTELSGLNVQLVTRWSWAASHNSLSLSG